MKVFATRVALVFLALSLSWTSASSLPPADQECLACHGEAGAKSDAGKSIAVDPAKHAASAHAVLSCKDCHTAIKEFPHPAKITKVQCSTCHEEEAKSAPASVHSMLGEPACGACHGNVHELTTSENLIPGKCTDCHAQEVKQLKSSIHGQAAKNGDPDAPKCASCHGPIHTVKPSVQADSTVFRRNLPDTCAKCHSDPGFLSRHKIPVVHPVDSYKQSVHGRAVALGKDAATCSSCHGSHDIYPATDSRSKVNHWRVPETCAQCHQEIAREFNESVHGEAVKAGNGDVPICVDCHGEHLITDPKSAGSLLNAVNVSAQTCGRCHADPRLALRNDLPADRLPSYAQSYHGLALKEGKVTAANCASCHGVHSILRSSDPRSTVNAANLRTTCGHCHKGVVEAKFTIGRVHVATDGGQSHPVVKWIRWTYLVLIPATLAFMLLHNLVDFLAKLIRRQPRRESGDMVLRMNLWFRIAHWGIMASFPTLVFTGFALKYKSWWSTPLLLWESGVGVRGGLHRAAAVVMILATLYHFVHLALKKRDRSFLWAMIPTVKDATDMLHVFRYNLGLTKEEPKFAKFNYAEKMEYWAFLWGTVVMGVSGFLLWFNNFTLRHFPKWVTDAATAVHWYEALLATLAILIWHFYLVIFDPMVYPMDTAWLDGKIPADHYRHSRPEYFRTLRRAGLVELPSDPADYKDEGGNANAPADPPRPAP
ncbi:MAG: cytochrome b/b6 domain-containing protein [Acidobacteriia bacterium]|nr:cytochrome b/b6 domain-containing protein [Terriglobia bacterium]